ncbi:MAG: hypothetical protein H6668_22470 [Ardenticatenaceae bacterium]|nr:hypothetical protein [Ardenticatenaceae bacterium]
MESQKEDIAAAGMQIVAIGLGQPKHAERYCGQLAPSVTCLTNEEPDLNREYGLTRGSLLQLVGPAGLANGARAWGKGFRQGKSTGDEQMLPGTFVIDKVGMVRYAYYSANAGDHPEITAVLRQVAQQM